MKRRKAAQPSKFSVSACLQLSTRLTTYLQQSEEDKYSLTASLKQSVTCE